MIQLARFLAFSAMIVFANSVSGQVLKPAAKTARELADQANSKGDYEGALRILSDALKQNPSDPQALCDRANLFKLTGKYQRATADYEALLQSKVPQMAWQGYAELLATCPDEKFRNPPNAIKYATSALNFAQAKFPDSQAVSELKATLAAAYAQQGKFDEAIRWQKDAIQRSHPSQHPSMKSCLQLYENGQPFIQQPIINKKS